MQQEKFLWSKRFKSFDYAGRGIKRLLVTEHNAWIHLAATIAVIMLAIGFHVSFAEAALLAAAIGFVWMAELFNTVIEKLMDFISKEKHPQIALIKDMSAGAVLIAAIIAFVIGCLIFIPKIFSL